MLSVNLVNLLLIKLKTDHMKRKDVFAAFARKLGISRQNLENYRINDGRIYLPYLQSIFTDIKKQLQSDRKNYNLVDEFSARSANPWAYLRTDAGLLTLVRLLTLHTGRTAAKVRAECTRPRITPSLLWEFLAVQMETSVDKLDREMSVRDIKLPLTGNESHSWLTFVIWGDNIFGDGTLSERADEIAGMKVSELFSFWTRP
jgi:hypothetical protein